MYEDTIQKHIQKQNQTKKKGLLKEDCWKLTKQFHSTLPLNVFQGTNIHISPNSNRKIIDSNLPNRWGRWIRSQERKWQMYSAQNSISVSTDLSSLAPPISQGSQPYSASGGDMDSFPGGLPCNTLESKPRGVQEHHQTSGRMLRSPLCPDFGLVARVWVDVVTRSFNKMWVDGKYGKISTIIYRLIWFYYGKYLFSFGFLNHQQYCWWKKSCTSWNGKYPIIYVVFIHRRWFLNHQHYGLGMDVFYQWEFSSACWTTFEDQPSEKHVV